MTGEEEGGWLSLFGARLRAPEPPAAEIVELAGRMARTDVETLSPLEALNLLAALVEEARKAQ